MIQIPRLVNKAITPHKSGRKLAFSISSRLIRDAVALPVVFDEFGRRKLFVPEVFGGVGGRIDIVYPSLFRSIIFCENTRRIAQGWRGPIFALQILRDKPALLL